MFGWVLVKKRKLMIKMGELEWIEAGRKLELREKKKNSEDDKGARGVRFCSRD